MKLLCSDCNRDITRTMKFYFKNNPYCYDCYTEYKKAHKKPKTITTRDMYKSGMPVSKIAKVTSKTPQEIYEELSKREKK